MNMSETVRLLSAHVCVFTRGRGRWSVSNASPATGAFSPRRAYLQVQGQRPTCIFPVAGCVAKRLNMSTSDRFPVKLIHISTNSKQMEGKGNPSNLSEIGCAEKGNKRNMRGEGGCFDEKGTGKKRNQRNLAGDCGHLASP